MIYKDIEKENLSKAYLFYGEEKLLIENTLKGVIQNNISIDFADFNYYTFEGKDLEYEKLINAAETLPLMSNKKLIVVKDVSGFNENNDLNDEFYDFLKNLGEYIILIFIEGNDKLNKNTKLYKFFTKEKRNIEFSKLKELDTVSFIEKYLKKHKKVMTRSNIMYFIKKTNYHSRNLNITLLDIKNELDKLIASTTEKEINKEEIDFQGNDLIDENIFGFLNYLSERKLEGALNSFSDLYSLNEPVQKIMVMFIRQVRLLLSLKLLRGEGYSDMDIQRQVGIKPYEYSKLSRHINRFSLEFLKSFYNQLLESDRLMKSTSIDERTLMETLVVKFCK